MNCRTLSEIRVKSEYSGQLEQHRDILLASPKETEAGYFTMVSEWEPTRAVFLLQGKGSDLKNIVFEVKAINDSWINSTKVR